MIECARLILLTSVLVFIYLPQHSGPDRRDIDARLRLFRHIAEALSPYEFRWDCWVSRAGHVIMYVSMYVTLLLKVDVSGERASSQRVFEAILVSAHAQYFGCGCRSLCHRVQADKRPPRKPHTQDSRRQKAYVVQGTVEVG